MTRLPAEMTRWLTWGAFLMSLPIYAIVGFLAVRDGAPSGPSAIPAWLFPLAAVLTGAVSFLFPRGDEEGTTADPATGERIPIPARMLVIWGMSEAVGVIGLIRAFLAGDASASLPYLGAAAVLLVLHRPRS